MSRTMARTLDSDRPSAKRQSARLQARKAFGDGLAGVLRNPSLRIGEYPDGHQAGARSRVEPMRSVGRNAQQVAALTNDRIDLPADVEVKGPTACHEEANFVLGVDVLAKKLPQ